MDFQIQFDVKEIGDQWVRMNLYTGVACVTSMMPRADYDLLNHKGFFHRSGNEKDSAGVWNTTLVYEPKQQSNL